MHVLICTKLSIVRKITLRKKLFLCFAVRFLLGLVCVLLRFLVVISVFLCSSVSLLLFLIVCFLLPLVRCRLIMCSVHPVYLNCTLIFCQVVIIVPFVPLILSCLLGMSGRSCILILCCFASDVLMKFCLYWLLRLKFDSPWYCPSVLVHLIVLVGVGPFISLLSACCVVLAFVPFISVCYMFLVVS